MNPQRIRLGFVLFCVLCVGCSRKITLSGMQTGYSLLSEEIKKEILKVEESVVGVNARILLEIHTYEYVTRNGRPVSDPTSPLGYKLLSSNGSDGVIIADDEKMLSGGGLIIDRGFQAEDYAILTSSHLVAPKDTTDIYYVDKDGVQTDVLFQRHIVKNVVLSVRGSGNWHVTAQLVANDPIDDLAVILAETKRRLGAEYPNRLAYDRKMSWGDWVFIFGYPREIKQMTGGWVSKSPYRGTFAVDAVVRFGFSGGPVFAISKEQSQLVFVGVIKSVPSGKMDYIAPDVTLPVGYRLRRDDVDKLMVQRQIVVSYGSAYCVSPKRIERFLKRTRMTLERLGIVLAPRYF